MNSQCDDSDVRPGFHSIDETAWRDTPLARLLQDESRNEPPTKSGDKSSQFVSRKESSDLQKERMVGQVEVDHIGGMRRPSKIYQPNREFAPRLVTTPSDF